MTDSSSHIWSSLKIQSHLGLQEQKLNYRYPGDIGTRISRTHRRTRIYPGHTGELGLPGHTCKLGYPGQTSPTTDQPVQLQFKKYSPAGALNRATRDLEQIECL